MYRPALMLAVSATVVVAIVGIATVTAQVRTPSPTPPSSSQDFVGAEACAACHSTKYETWKGGRHSKMIQPAGPASVKGDFSKHELTLRESPFRLEVRDRAYFITESILTGKPVSHRIDYTLGSRRIQHYLTTLENGWIVILPPTWDVERREWFHNMDIVRPDEDARTLIQQWNKNCVGCHVSEQVNDYAADTGAYATHWRDFGTTCERCHGPGRAHVAKYSRPTADPSSDPLIVKPTKLPAAANSMICAQCHSLRNVIAPGYQAGQNYYDYFLPQLEYGPVHTQDPSYWADGRPRRFSNDAVGLWQSQCFLKGGATCTTCHVDPHEPDVDRNPGLATTNNALCTNCHAQIGAQLTSHTRHQAGSTGSACVECHMPKTVTGIRATMRDHTIGLPAPENSVRFGIPNACTTCHRDREDAWAVSTLARWWPNGQRGKLVERADAFTSARARRPSAIGPLIRLLADDQQGPIVQANAAGYLRGYSTPRVVSALVASTRAQAPLVRSVAVASLGQVTNSLEIAAIRAAVIEALDDSDRSVRVSAVASLIGMPGAPMSDADRQRFNRASRDYIMLAAQHPDDAASQRDLGVLYLLTGDAAAAAAALEACLRLEPGRPSATYLLAIARLGQQRATDARALLRAVLPGDPFYAEARKLLADAAVH